MPGLSRTRHQERSLAKGEIPKCLGEQPSAPQPGCSTPGQVGSRPCCSLASGSSKPGCCFATDRPGFGRTSSYTGNPKTPLTSAERLPRRAPADSPGRLHEQRCGSRNTSKAQLGLPISSSSFPMKPSSQDRAPSWRPPQCLVNQERLSQSLVVFVVHKSV